jgi:isochorismate pyruvate lyase
MRPSAPASLQEVRARIDALDAKIVPLLAERFDCARLAAACKSGTAEVPAPERAARVIANARALAVAHGAPADGVEKVYRALIAAMIDLELELHRQRDRV